MAKILDGKKLAAEIRAQVKDRVGKMEQPLRLAVILVGDDPASHLYVGLKQEACEETGIGFEKILYPANTPENEIIDKIRELNADQNVTGILVQLPLPAQDADKIVAVINPKKDVDGFHPANLGNLKAGRPALISATALGIMKLIAETEEKLRGKHAVLVCSQIFAEPISILLSEQGVKCEVVNPNDENLGQKTTTGDILIAAAGRPHLIAGAMIKPGAIVIDVGTTKIAEWTAGDVDEQEAERTAGWLTPVPGGVGPMTVAMLLMNIIKAREWQTAEAEK